MCAHTCTLIKVSTFRQAMGSVGFTCVLLVYGISVTPCIAMGEQVDMQLVSSLRASLEALQPHASADGVPANLHTILEAPALHESLEALALHTLADEVLIHMCICMCARVSRGLGPAHSRR
jgi:hypothetical protein